MRILGDSQITNADITATNILSAALTNKLQTFQLTDNMRTIANSTQIDFTFNGVIPDLNCIALCGSNLSPAAVVTLSYSDTDINSPDDSIVLPIFSTLHQVFFLSSVLNKKYWRITIADTGNSILFFGYLYTGVYFQVPAVQFAHGAALSIFSNGQFTPTGQRYGSKLYNGLPVDFTMFLEYDDLEEYFAIKQSKQDIDPVLLIEFEESYAMSLYRPKYGVLITAENPYPMQNVPLTYEIPARLEEIF